MSKIHKYDQYTQLRKDQKAEFVNNQLINIIDDIERNLLLYQEKVDEVKSKKEMLKKVLESDDVDEIFHYISNNCNNHSRGYDIDEQWRIFQDKTKLNRG